MRMQTRSYIIICINEKSLEILKQFYDVLIAEYVFSEKENVNFKL